MFEKVNIDSSVAVYEQIENKVKFALASGRLKAGDQLPTVKAMAEQLGVNLNTVTKSYRDLEVMGLVWTRRGMGVFIQNGAEAKCRDSVRAQVVGRLHEIVCEAKASGMGQKETMALVKRLFSEVGEPYAS